MSQRRACPSTWRLRQGISGDLRKGSGPAEKLHRAKAPESVLTAAQSSEQRRPRWDRRPSSAFTSPLISTGTFLLPPLAESLSRRYTRVTPRLRSAVSQTARGTSTAFLQQSTESHAPAPWISAALLQADGHPCSCPGLQLLAAKAQTQE